MLAHSHTDQYSNSMTQQYLSEILEQPSIIENLVADFESDEISALARDLLDGRFRRIVLTGMGTSLYSTMPLQMILTHATITPVERWEAAHLLHYGAHLIGPDTLLIAVSQSGESAEIVNLLDAGIQPAHLISVTNGPDNTLAKAAQLLLLTRAGEEATVSTKTYTATLALLHLLGQQLVGKDVNAAKESLLRVTADMRAMLSNSAAMIDQLGNFLGQRDTLAFIGRGYTMATVYTAELITQEASKVFAKGYTGGEFRHGPLELVRDGFCAVIFLGADHTRGLNEKLAAQIAELGAQVVLIGPEPPEIPGKVLNIPIPTHDPSRLSILSILPAQLMTIPLARANGFEPAVFTNASKVTRSE